jgi:23S rRNA (uracil1939-C5)-methyltransferase
VKSTVAEPETGKIADTMTDGRGVVRSPGKTVFVHGAIKGETVKFVRRKKKRNYDEAELLEILVAAPERVEPLCEYFGLCGGCSLQHISPSQQLVLKQSVLLESLQRIGSVQPDRVLQPIVEDAWAYRRKARLAVKHVQKKGRVLVGFRERNKPYVADMLHCETLHPSIGGAIEALSEFIGDLSIHDRIPQIETAVGDNGTAMIFRVLDPPSAADLERFARFQASQGVQVYLQEKGPESVRPLTGEPAPEALFYDIPGFNVSIQFTPTDFLQVHAQVNRRMIDQAVKLLEPQADLRVLDLYCGLGNFTLPLATLSKEVCGVDFDEDMIARARGNARRSGIKNVSFYQGDLSRPMDNPTISWDGYDLVVLDPPRTGSLELMDVLGQMRARRILYVSCHPGSLARDAGNLVQTQGYSLAAAGILDMFPQTSHLESMALFELRG